MSIPLDMTDPEGIPQLVVYEAGPGVAKPCRLEMFDSDDCLHTNQAADDYPRTVLHKDNKNPIEGKNAIMAALETLTPGEMVSLGVVQFAR